MAVQHGIWKIGDTPQPLAAIRLGSETLLDDLKDLARIHGLGYQPLMKQILTQFVEAEKNGCCGRKPPEWLVVKTQTPSLTSLGPPVVRDQ